MITLQLKQANRTVVNVQYEQHYPLQKCNPDNTNVRCALIMAYHHIWVLASSRALETRKKARRRSLPLEKILLLAKVIAV